MVGFIRLLACGSLTLTSAYQADGRSAAEASAAPIGETRSVSPIVLRQLPGGFVALNLATPNPAMRVRYLDLRVR